MAHYSTNDLTQRPPRSPRVRLGGYAHLPRLLDKARAVAAGTPGEYHYNCPLDGHFFAFTGIGHEALLAEVKGGDRSDSEMLAWVQARTKRLPSEIAAWSAWLENHGAGGHEGHAWFGESIQAAAATRKDVWTFFDLLDLDDYVTYGGKG